MREREKTKYKDVDRTLNHVIEAIKMFKKHSIFFTSTFKIYIAYSFMIECK